jgi:hypothetical protein
MLSVEQLNENEDMIQSLLNMCLYGVTCSFDPHLPNTNQL